MSKTTNTIISWLEHLWILMPPRDITLIGAGNGRSMWTQWLLRQAPQTMVTLVEADTQQFTALQRMVTAHSEAIQHCQLLNTVVSPKKGTVPFFLASSVMENGLIEPESLQSLWPNLQTIEVEEHDAVTLDALLSEQHSEVVSNTSEILGQHTGRWLLIDCLPAGSLLKAVKQLHAVEVVVVRVLLNSPDSALASLPEGTSLTEVAQILRDEGMLQASLEITRHPSIGYAIFVRDIRAAMYRQIQQHQGEYQQLNQVCENHAKLAQERQAQIEQLTQAKAVADKRMQETAQQAEQLGKARDAQAKLAQERQAQIEQLTQAKAAAGKQVQEAAQQAEQLGKARDAQAKLAQERQAQIEQLTQAKAAADKQVQEAAQQAEQLGKARDAQAKLAQERQAQIEQLTQAKAVADKRMQEAAQQAEQLGKARDAQAKLAQERQAQIEQLTQAKAAADKQVQEAAQQAEQLGKARDAQAKLAQERQAQIEQLTQAKAAADKRMQETAQQAEQLGKARDAQAKLAQERQAQIEQLTQAKAAVDKQVQEAVQQAEQLGKARDAQAKLAQERQAQIEQLIQAKAAADKQVQEAAQQAEQLGKARDAQAKLAQERQAQIEQLTQAKAAADKRVQEVAQQAEQLSKARDAQAKLAQERQAQIEQLTQAKAAADKQVQEAAQQAEQLGKARDALTQLAQERQVQIEKLAQAKTAAETQVREYVQKLEQLDKIRYEQAVQAQIKMELAAQQQDMVQLQQLQIDIRKQANEIGRLNKNINANFKKEIANAAKQIEAFTGLQNYFITGELPIVNTERHKWPVSPDFSLYLIELIETNGYDLIVEFGSGISTVIVAKALMKIKNRRKNKKLIDFVSFEHLEKYYQKTYSQLMQAGVDNAVQLHYAPLQPWEAPNGNVYNYYSCQAALETLAKKYSNSSLHVLVIIDGPPAEIGPHARYPAGPLILQNFAEAKIDLLLDDYIRDEEKEIAQLWQDEIILARKIQNITERKFEKDACLISITNA